MGFSALSLQGAGAGISTVGAFYNAKGQKSTLNAQAHLDETNAKLATMSAQSAILTGQRQEQVVKLNTAQLKSKQRTAMAANGIDLSSTTPVAVLTSTDAIGEVDAATVAANAMRTAFGYETQSVNFSNRARGARAAADGINPFVSAGGSLLSGAGRVAESWYKLDKAGAFDEPAAGEKTKDSWFARTIQKSNLVSDALY